MPATSRSWRMNASPAPRSASTAARCSAKRASSRSPVRRRTSSAASRVSGSMPRSSSAWSIWATLRSRWRNRRSASSIAASAPSSAGSALDGDRFLEVGLDHCFVGGLRWEESRRDDLLLGCLRLDPREDLLHEVGVLREEARRVLAPLPEALVPEAEVRARLLDDLLLQRDVEHGALPRDPAAVDDVELRLLEGWCDLVLHDLDANAVAERLRAVLQRLDP